MFLWSAYLCMLDNFTFLMSEKLISFELFSTHWKPAIRDRWWDCTDASFPWLAVQSWNIANSAVQVEKPGKIAFHLWWLKRKENVVKLSDWWTYVLRINVCQYKRFQTRSSNVLLTLVKYCILGFRHLPQVQWAAILWTFSFTAGKQRTVVNILNNRLWTEVLTL